MKKLFKRTMICMQALMLRGRIILTSRFLMEAIHFEAFN